MYFEYLEAKDQELSKQIINNELLPKLKSILHSSNTFFSLLTVLDKNKDLQNTWDTVLDSIVLLNQNKYVEASEKISNMSETEKKFFSLSISITNKKEEYQYIEDLDSIIIKSYKEESKDNSTEENKHQEIYIEDVESLKNKYTDILKEKKKNIPIGDTVREKLNILENNVSEINLEDVYTTIYKQYAGEQIQNLKILLKIITKDNKDILTISPYIQTGENTKNVNNNNFNESYDTKPILQATNTVRIPVLMYHQIAEAPKGSSKFKNGLYVSPQMFEKQIAYLTKMNYKTISSKEFSEILASGKNPSQKTIMLTFDDGTSSHYTQAYPILKKYGQTGVFFVPSSRTSISSDQLKEMALNGMSIDSHSSTHPNLAQITDKKKLVSEIAGSKSSLQARTGKTVYAIAYPGCVANDEAFNTVASSGYVLGFSCGKKIDHYPSNKYSISRVHVFNDMESFVNLLSGKN
jgi:peptidoglycan/xylan/chitin deacetylase (PgdA/CDA1 family)